MAEKKEEKKANVSQDQLAKMIEKNLAREAEERKKRPAKGDYAKDDGIVFPPSDDGIVDKD